MIAGVTIGRAAAFAGVTVKTVRHYHRLGLVDEPARDSSGYRRYHSSDLLRLVQVRTLAAAGVPLAGIPALLDAQLERLRAEGPAGDPGLNEPDRFAVSLADVEQRLTDRIDELIERRATLRRLASGDRALLPDRACAILDRLAGFGVDTEFIAMQRESLVLAKALAPELFDTFLTQLEQRLDDDEYVDLFTRSLQAAAWEPDDPRLEELASALAAKLLARRELLVLPTSFEERPDAALRYGLINHHQSARTFVRLTELIEAKIRAAGVDVPYQ